MSRHRGQRAASLLRSLLVRVASGVPPLSAEATSGAHPSACRPSAAAHRPAPNTRDGQRAEPWPAWSGCHGERGYVSWRGCACAESARDTVVAPPGGARTAHWPRAGAPGASGASGPGSGPCRGWRVHPALLAGPKGGGAGPCPSGYASASGGVEPKGIFAEANTLANWISGARAASGPVLAHWIVTGAWTEALVGLAAAGASDWLDGYVAKSHGQSSALGSYLDPLADKIVIASVVGALGWVDLLPPWLVGLIVGRDVLLLGGALVHRAHQLNWRFERWSHFFQTQGASGGGSSPVPAAGFVKPIYISKVNTALQFALTGGCVLHQLQGVPDQWLLVGLGVTTGATTLASLAIYAYKFRAVLSPPRS